MRSTLLNERKRFFLKNVVLNLSQTKYLTKLYKPCKYGRSLHIKPPNTKSLSSVPMSVNGIHKTPSKISDTAKFNKNTLVIVRIRRFWTSVNMTSALPVTANNKIVVYSGIWMRPIDSHDGVKFGCCECCCSSGVVD